MHSRRSSFLGGGQGPPHAKRMWYHYTTSSWYQCWYSPLVNILCIQKKNKWPWCVRQVNFHCAAGAEAGYRKRICCFIFLRNAHYIFKEFHKIANDFACHILCIRKCRPQLNFRLKTRESAARHRNNWFWSLKLAFSDSFVIVGTWACLPLNPGPPACKWNANCFTTSPW